MGGQAVPKLIPRAMMNLSDELRDRPFTVMTGGSGTPSFEEAISALNVNRRYYYLSGGEFRRRVNKGEVDFFDFWVSEYSRLVRRRIIPSPEGIDVTVLEVTGIGENGEIIPSLSVDSSMALVEASSRVILEVNTGKPVLEGLHDMYLSEQGVPIPISNVMDRAGKPYMKIPDSKIAAIVVDSAEEEAGGSYRKVGGNDAAVAENVSEVIENELGSSVKATPLQLGAGSVSSAIVERLDMESIKIWSEIIPSKWTAFIGSKISEISASSIYTLPGEDRYTEDFLDNFKSVRKNIVLRPNEITNSSEVIARLGVVSVQQAISIDIFGAANVSHIGGKIYNGVGGSGDFTRAAGTTVLALSSVTADTRHSKIVPMLPVVDIPKQDVDFVVTEQGIADLRALNPVNRARAVISNCSHPAFRERLSAYLEKALKNPQHVPVNPPDALEWMQ